MASLRRVSLEMGAPIGSGQSEQARGICDDRIKPIETAEVGEIEPAGDS